MAGKYEPIPTTEPEGEGNEGYDKDETNRWQEEHSPRRAESGRVEKFGMKDRKPPPPRLRPWEEDFHPSTPTTKTSTSKQETSFIDEKDTDTPSAGSIIASREKTMEELEKDVRKVFPNIKEKLLPLIRDDGYGRLIINLGVKGSVDHVIAFDGRPSREFELKKFPSGIKRDLGKTREEVNQENYERLKKEEEAQAKREQEREEARRLRAENDEKLRDAKEREENLEKVVKEQEEAKKYALSTEDKESHTRSAEASRNALRQVSAEVDGFRVERDRLEQAERNADARSEEGEREVEALGERVDQRLLPLRERIKEIFKKHGFTVIAVATAIATVIGVVVSNLKAGLTKVAKGVGNGLKELGKKLGEILPGMIGAIASFIFKTAGEVIGFLAKNAWLLVVGLVVLAVEQFKKKSR